MAKRRKGQPIHGWVVLDKPAGLGSTQAVAAVKRAFNAQKAGHGGTLDPFATGLLPIALGEATKTVSYVMDGVKAYRFTLRFGIETYTLDPEGAVAETSEIRPDRAAIESVMTAFVGDIEQLPPKFSALKVDGQRAYDLARTGADISMQPRRVHVESLTLIDIPDADHAVFETVCGKGTYIRSLGRDLARALGTFGSLSALRRTRVGPFTEADAILLAALEEFGHNRADSRGILAVEAALDGIPAMALSEAEAVRLRNGQPVSLLRKVDLARIAGLRDGDEVMATENGKVIALARYGKGEIRPLRVLIRQFGKNTNRYREKEHAEYVDYV